MKGNKGGVEKWVWVLEAAMVGIQCFFIGESWKIWGGGDERKEYIEGPIIGFYEYSFKEEVDWRPKLDGLAFNQIGKDKRVVVWKRYGEDEVWEAVECHAGLKLQD